MGSINSKKSFIGVVILCVIFSQAAIAQPSGGPYGPVQQKYELPEVEGTIYYVAPDGDADASGETLEEPTTIESAIKRVVTGDAIILRGGVYRTGDLVFNQQITMQPYEDEQPILKGTYVADNWHQVRNGLWATSWQRLFSAEPDDWWLRERHGRATPLHRFNNDMVFVDGRLLKSAGWEGEVDEDSYFIDYDTSKVYLSIDPTDKFVEITAYDCALHRTIDEVHGKECDGKGPTVRGITFTQYAYRAIEIDGKYPEGLSPEAEHGKDVVGTTFDNCAITHCSRVAGYFKGDNMVIKNCLISDTHMEGIYIISSNDVLLEKNILRRNNIHNITGYYPAAVKIFNQSYRVTCRDNLVIEQPNSNGIWYDVGNIDGVIVDNWFQNVGNVSDDFSSSQPWPSRNAFFFEISKGAVVAGNVFVNCDQGILVLNSADVEMYQNTFINSTVCISRNTRSAVGDHFGWHPSTGPDVDERHSHVFVNNLLTGGANFTRPLLSFSQHGALCDRLTEPQVKQMDYNVYVRRAKTTQPLIWWSPADGRNCQVSFDSLDGLRKLQPEFAANSKYLVGYQGPLFKGSELGNYRLMPQFPAADSATELPAKIKELPGSGEKGTPYVGAYPPAK